MTPHRTSGADDPGDVGNAPKGPARGGPRWHHAAATLLVTAFLLQTILSLKDNSTVTDEAADIAAGYSYWHTRDARINREHPALIKLWLTLPLLPLGREVPTEDASWRTGSEEYFIAAFLARNYRDLGTLRWTHFLSRIPIVLLGVLLALFVRRWATELWGPEAGLAALFLFVFEPNIIAQSTLATMDLALAAFTFISMYYVWRWQRSRRTADMVLASIGLGCALLSKYTAIAFLPLFLAQILVGHLVQRQPGGVRWVAAGKEYLRLVLSAAAVVIAIYAAAFNWHPVLQAGKVHHTAAKMLARAPLVNAGIHAAHITTLAHRLWVPDVESYVAGAYDQLLHLAAGDGNFLMGHHSQHGWWYYFLIAFLIKAPIPLLLLALVRLALLASLPVAPAEYVLLTPIAGILALSCLSTVDLGLRYILPIFPFLFVWLSRVVAFGLWGGAQNCLPLGQSSLPCPPEVPATSGGNHPELKWLG